MAQKNTVIIGAGFAGLETAKQLARADTNITLFDKTNHHLFQPLLYQVATAALSPVDIAAPIRLILQGQKNLTFLMGEVTHIDKKKQLVTVDDTNVYPFDYLVVAPGARHSYFGKDSWEKNAPGLKTLADASILREKILAAFERAERAPNEEQANIQMCFAVIGGGPTGVELAGAIAEIAFDTLIHDYRHISSKQAQIHLIEGASQLLPGFPETLGRAAQKSLEALGVKVHLNFLVTDVTSTYVASNNHMILTPNIIWAAGNKASSLLQTLDIALDRQGRAIVEPDLSIPGYPHIFVVGDAACAADKNGNPFPALAPVAKQQGNFVAKIIQRSIRGENQKRAVFSYVDKGSLATIGKGKAVGTIGPLQVKGFFAWLIWSVIHVYYLIGFRNRLFVIFQWAFWYLRGKRRVQLITTPLNKSHVGNR